MKIKRQCAAVVRHGIHESLSVLQCDAVCYSVLQCVAVVSVAVCCSSAPCRRAMIMGIILVSALQCVAVRCSVLLCVALCCTVLQCPMSLVL